MINDFKLHAYDEDLNPGIFSADQTVNTVVPTLLDCAADVDKALAILNDTNSHTVDGYLTH